MKICYTIYVEGIIYNIKEVNYVLKIFIEEFLEEMATIYKSKEYNILIAVTPDSGRAGNPYFKFLNNSNYLNEKNY